MLGEGHRESQIALCIAMREGRIDDVAIGTFSWENASSIKANLGGFTRGEP